jgi:hydrophobe/amphiphile efflux-3 (HAE3) family protein
MQGSWGRLARAIGRHPVRSLLATVGLAALLAAGTARLDFVTRQDSLIDASSPVSVDNAHYQDRFGGEPMLILLTGDIRVMSQEQALDEIRALEEDLRSTGEFHSVVGPATALEFAIGQLSVAPDLITAAAERDARAAAETARRAAGRSRSTVREDLAAARAADAVREERAAMLAAETARLGAVGTQSLSNPSFVDFLLFGPDGELRPSLRTTYIDGNHALVIVRLEGNASIEDQARAAGVVKDIVARHPIAGVDALATGPPVLLGEIDDYLRGGMATLGAIAVGVMVLVLLLVFRVRWPLLPLAVVVVGAAAAFGAVGFIGIPLTLVTISGLPILIGLGVDFAIQMQNRFDEERKDDATIAAATRRTYAYMGPPLLVAMVAAVAGVLALRRADVPMIRDFGLMLAIGVVVLVVAALLAVLPVLVLRDRHRPRPRRPRRRVIEAAVHRVCSLPGGAALPLLGVAVVTLVTGLAIEGRLPIQTDPERWVNQSGDAVAELRELRDGTGYSSELSILVEAADVTDPQVAAWMHRFGAEEVARHRQQLFHATSMADQAANLEAGTPGGDDIARLLAVAPGDVSRALISEDRTAANLVFPIAPVSLAERERVLDQLAADLRGDLAPPPGVTARPAGLAVIGAELVDRAEAGRQILTLTALAFVFGWLLVAHRSLTRALLVLVPVGAAVGLSSIAVALVGIELTPLTSVAGPLVIAVGTEFSVLVVARYREERELGRDPRDAVGDGVTSIARAFVASGLTLVAGFGVLAFSPLPLLRDFGIVVALDVLSALASTLVLLPPLLIWADRGNAGDGAGSEAGRTTGALVGR